MSIVETEGHEITNYEIVCIQNVAICIFIPIITPLECSMIIVNSSTSSNMLLHNKRIRFAKLNTKAKMLDTTLHEWHLQRLTKRPMKVLCSTSKLYTLNETGKTHCYLLILQLIPMAEMSTSLSTLFWVTVA